jgi:hypothetical protein
MVLEIPIFKGGTEIPVLHRISTESKFFNLNHFNLIFR